MKSQHFLFALLWLTFLQVLFFSLYSQEVRGQKSLTVIKRELKLNEKVTSSIKEGEVHRYEIRLKRGQSLRANVKEKGVDVSAAILHHDNPEKLEQYHVDGYVSEWGAGFERETLIFVIDRDDLYSVNIRADKLWAKEGMYDLEILVDSESVEKSWERMKAVNELNSGINAVQINQYATINSLQISLSMWEKLGERYWQGRTNQALAFIYFKLGKTDEAIETFKRALDLFSEEDKFEKAVTKITLGDTYLAFLADFDSAGKQYREALVLLEKVDGDFIEDHLRNLLSIVDRRELDFEKFLALIRARNNKDLEALALTQIISSIPNSPNFSNSSERKKTLKTYTSQALALSKENIELELKSQLMFASCSGYSLLVEGREFEPFCYESLLLNYEENKVRETTTFAMIFFSWLFEKNNANIFYGKQSVKGLQEFRKNAQTPDIEIRQNFLRQIRGLYRDLADNLISKGRYNEAHQIINLSRDEEFFDANFKSAEPTEISLTKREDDDESLLKSSLIKTKQAYKDFIRFRDYIGNNKPRPEDAERLKKLEANYKQAYDDYLAAFKKIEESFNQPSFDKDKIDEIVDTKDMQAALSDLQNQTGQKVAVIYTLEAEKSYRALLITPDKITAVTSLIEDSEFQQKNIKFLEQLSEYDKSKQTPKFSVAETQKTGRELYEIIFAPIAAKLKELNIKPDVLMWSLDGTLRYVPVGALYDGKQYLVERYRNVVFTRANTERMLAPVSEKWTGSGFYNSLESSVAVKVSQNDKPTLKDFQALKFAKQEIESIFSKGFVSGKVLFNRQFTKKSLSEALKLELPVVHIASHFRFEPGESASSFLVLGDGEKLTLEDIRNEPGEFFKGVELLTLSACETGVQKERESDGREIDGFAELAQRKGAKAILASLWKVDDQSTSQLMTQFYQIRQTKKLSKAEALQRAQLSLLKSKDFSHPYYWSPFILIGNWK